ncbi:MAG: hypothetical protein ACI9HK_004375, partial [Pirellulaceae bacterium]
DSAVISANANQPRKLRITIARFGDRFDRNLVGKLSRPFEVFRKTGACRRLGKNMRLLLVGREFADGRC